MKASEAKSLVERSKSTKGQYNEIIKLITAAAKYGSYEVWYYEKTVSPGVRKKLKELGYKVGETMNDRNDLVTNISWR